MLVGKTLFKQYKIVEEIGSGAFGQTYIAIDTAFPGEPRRVVKHLCPIDTDPQAINIAKRLFKTEAQSLSRLGEHDRIPRLFSYFEEDGEFYLVQELIEGHCLSQEFQPGKRWSEEETVNFLQELLEILSFVHQNNTIHRDLKPANIMRRHRDDKLVIIDFGAVKEIITVDRDGMTHLSHLSQTIGVGTLSYMPPEQAKGRPGKYSDIYAVGMLGIQALTGLPSSELPQDSEALPEMWQNLKIEVSPQLKHILERMVNFQYKKRFPNAAEALKAFIPTELDNSNSQQTIPPTRVVNSKSPKKLILGLLGILGLTGAGFATQAVLNRPNYSQLETYLENKEWQKADTETDRLILGIVREDSSLNPQAIEKFSCEALKKIDELWTESSQGRFGFTPQKQAYLETGNEINKYTQATYEAFGDRVKWRTFGTWGLYGDLKFTDIAPPGHLPSPGRIGDNRQDLRIREREMLLSRFDACGL